MTLVNESIEQGISWNEGKAEAFNHRGTFKFLTGDAEGAMEDLLKSVEFWPGFTQSLVKLASVYMEQANPEKAFQCFEDAIQHNPNDADIYYHRGQGTQRVSFFNLLLKIILQFYSSWRTMLTLRRTTPNPASLIATLCSVISS